VAGGGLDPTAEGDGFPQQKVSDFGAVKEKRPGIAVRGCLVTAFG